METENCQPTLPTPRNRRVTSEWQQGEPIVWLLGAEASIVSSSFRHDGCAPSPSVICNEHYNTPALQGTTAYRRGPRRHGHGSLKTTSIRHPATCVSCTSCTRLCKMFGSQAVRSSKTSRFHDQTSHPLFSELIADKVPTIPAACRHKFTEEAGIGTTTNINHPILITNTLEEEQPTCRESPRTGDEAPWANHKT